MESRSTNIKGYCDLKREFVTYACEILGHSLPENIDTISASITITIQEKSEGCCVDTVTLRSPDGSTTIQRKLNECLSTSQDPTQR
jgi:hypothetical protein